MRDQPRDRNPELFGDADRRGVFACGDDEQLGAKVGEIELEFFGAIRWVERRRGRGGSDGEERRRHLRPVVEHDADAVVRADALRGERCGDVGDERAQSAIGEWCAAW